MRMRVLLLEADNLLGQALLALAAADNIQLETLERPAGGWAPEQPAELIAETQPDLVINLAFYHQQFQLGVEDPLQLAAQQLFSEQLAEHCAASGAALLMLSSARVFDGKKGGAYSEKDEPAPTGVLGHLQAGLEETVRRCERHVILRFSWLLDSSSDGVFQQLIHELKRMPTPLLTEEWRGNPTPVGDAARIILAVIKQLDCAAPVYGTYHYGSSEATTWIGFGQGVVQELLGRGELQGDVAIQPVAFEHLPMCAGQPQNQSLLGRKLLMVFGIKPRTWRSQLPELLDAL